MDFDVIEEDEETKKAKKKKRMNDKMFLISSGLFVIAIILMIIYVITLDTSKNKPAEIVKPQTAEEKIKIVDMDSNERPIAVMIDNNIGDGRHAGLQEAYLSYEIIVEGGLTRIMSIYKDITVSAIGPIRSSRHYFLDYALESDAIYVHYGWSPYAEKDIKALNVNNINGMTDVSPFVRDSEQKAPHNVYTTTQKIKTFLDSKNYSSKSDNWKLLNYSVDKINLNEKFQNTDNTFLIEANTVSIAYSNSEIRSYNYDSVNQYYLRSMNGKAHVDGITNKQLSYKNIIIMKVSNKTLDNEGRQDLSTTGTGDGYYLTNGYAVPIKWAKESRASKTNYTYQDGTEIKVNDGNTFIQVVPVDNEIKIG